MTRASAYAGVIVAVIGLLQACGGGGSDSGGTNPPPPPPPPPPPGNILVPLTRVNAEPVGILILAPANDALWTMQYLVDVARYLHFARIQSETFNCSQSGTGQLTLQDNPPAGTLGVGDRVILGYTDCNGTTSGTLELDITAIAFESGDITSLDGQVTIDLDLLEFPEGQLAGAGYAAYRATTDRLSWLSTGFSIEFSTTNQEESMVDGRVEKVVTGSPFRYSLTMDGTIDSDFLNGRLTFQTEEPFGGLEGLWPDTGRLVAHGRDDSQIRFMAGSAQAGTAAVEVDANGDGVFDDVASSINWLDMTSGYPFGRTGDDDVQPPPDLPDVLGRHIALGAPGEGLAVDEVRGRIYVTIPSRNELLVFSAETLEVIRRVNVGSGPNGVSLSADREEIFVGLGGAGAIAIVDSDSFAVTHVVVAAELEHSNVYNVVEAAPGVLYAATGTIENGRIARVDRGSGVITPVGPAGPHIGEIELVGDPAHGLLYAGDGSGTFTPGLHKYDATDAGSAHLLENVNGALESTSRMSLAPGGNRLYLNSGQVISTVNFSPVGRIGQGIPWAMSNGLEIMVASNAGRLELSRYLATSLGFIDRIDTDCELDAEQGGFADIDRMAASPVEGQWIFLGGNLLCAIDLLHPSEPPGTGLPGVEPDPLPVRNVQSVAVSLPGSVYDAEYDAIRNRLYVSVPSTGELVTINLATHTVIEREVLGNQPRGLDLSPDGSMLAIMFHGNGDIGFKDLASGELEIQNLTSTMGTVAGNDVAWVGDDVLFAAPDVACCDDLEAYVVRVSRLNPAATRRSGGGEPFLFHIELTPSIDNAFLFLTSGSQTVRKLDLGLPDEPVVRSFTLDTTDITMGQLIRPSVSPDGERLAFSNGVVLRADNLFQVGQLASGGAVVHSPDGGSIYRAISIDLIDRYDATTFQKIERIDASCAGNPPARLLINDSGNELIASAATRVCFLLLDQPTILATQLGMRYPEYCDGACVSRRYHELSGRMRGWLRASPPRR